MKSETLEAVIADPKTFLARGLNVKARIAAKQKQIANWRRLAESITVPLKDAPSLSGDGYKQSLVENAVCNIVDLENEIIAEIKELINIERDIRAVINTLVFNDKHIVILEMRYLNGYSWSMIARRLSYGTDWVCRLHGSALQEIQCQAKRSR
jgi:DNA-directed RNA polymerase specialized sigma subunit